MLRTRQDADGQHGGASRDAAANASGVFFSIMALLDLKVSPKASRNAISGFMGEALKVSVTAAPERGKANQAVEELLAEALGLPRSAVQVVAGHTAKAKRVQVTGVSDAVLRQQLRTILERGAARSR
ncbi:MAG: DUF167 domain-containing protein [Nevskia sp.]|nr:DUF167 domain-containing protein [Nevskia sp.]